MPESSGSHAGDDWAIVAAIAGGDLRGELARALYRGDNVIDLTYEVAPEAGEGILGLGLLLNEADAFCLAGYQILVLAAAQVGFWQIATDLRIRLADWW